MKKVFKSMIFFSFSVLIAFGLVISTPKNSYSHSLKNSSRYLTSAKNDLKKAGKNLVKGNIKRSFSTSSKKPLKKLKSQSKKTYSGVYRPIKNASKKLDKAFNGTIKNLNFNMN